ncbi:MAG: DUF6444 domain-containing protein [Cyanobacteriota bacterium]
MTAPPSGISEADWLSLPAAVRTFILAQQQEIRAQREELLVLRQEKEQMRQQLTALAAELASLRERMGRNSRNSSKPPSSDSQGFKPPLKRKGSGRKRGGQPCHPGAGPELLPVERCKESHDHLPDTCRRCGNPLSGVDPAPHRHQVIDIPPIQAEVIEHRLHRLLCPRCSTSTCAELPQGVESSHYGPRLSSLVGLLGSAFPLSIGKTSELLDRLLGVSISGGAIVAIRARLAACLREPTEEALREARLQPVVYMDETGAPTGNADGGVDERHEGQGLGAALLLDGISRASSLSDAIGCRGLLVHAESEQAPGFYEHLIPEFERSPTDPSHLLLLLKDIRSTLGR